MSEGYVDCHTHLFPEKRLRKLMVWTRRFMADHPVPLDISADEAALQLRRAGARRWANLLFPVWPDEAASLHSFNAGLAERYPEITPFGGVLASDPDPLAVVEEAIEVHHMAGLKFHPMVQRFSPADPRLAPVFAHLDRLGLAVYIHTGYDEFYDWTLDLDGVESLVRAHPRVAFAFPHLNYPRLRWAFDMAERYGNVWLDTTNVFGSIAMARRDSGMSLDRSSADVEEVAALLAKRLPPLATRTMFGTDHPAGVGDLEMIFSDLASFGLDEATREQVVFRTGSDFLDRYGRPAP